MGLCFHNLFIWCDIWWHRWGSLKEPTRWISIHCFLSFLNLKICQDLWDLKVIYHICTCICMCVCLGCSQYWYNMVNLRCGVWFNCFCVLYRISPQYNDEDCSHSVMSSGAGTDSACEFDNVKKIFFYLSVFCISWVDSVVCFSRRRWSTNEWLALTLTLILTLTPTLMRFACLN